MLACITALQRPAPSLRILHKRTLNYGSWARGSNTGEWKWRQEVRRRTGRTRMFLWRKMSWASGVVGPLAPSAIICEAQKDNKMHQSSSTYNADEPWAATLANNCLLSLHKWGCDKLLQAAITLSANQCVPSASGDLSNLVQYDSSTGSLTGLK